MQPRLITIPISHYCEKARWALEHAGIAYLDERHLQIFHYLATYRAARTDSVPVLVTPSKVLTESRDILHWADEQSPADKKLYPADKGLRGETERLERSLDEGFGVAGRLWMYTFLLDDIPLILRYSKKHAVPWLELKALPLAFPFVKRHIHEILGLTATSREDSRALVARTFDEVAERLRDGRPYLTGDRFTAADLTFAALSASVLLPEKYGVELPKLDELPREMRDQVVEWRAHPAGRHALRMYERHR
ncbi:MAG: glutathione S-transferase family protein [Deltaproteobacteria bacterium]|nr:glutathione S-transferase family protein [Deltaproteobacteria bacterium]